MRTAETFMQSAVSVDPDTTVAELASLLLDTWIDGVCVIEEGKLVGVVTVMDLLFKRKRVHPPTVLPVLDALIPLGRMADFRHELEKIGAGTVRGIMSHPAIVVGPGAELDEVATLMVERHLTLLPVVGDKGLVGVVTKHSLLKASGLAAVSV